MNLLTILLLLIFNLIASAQSDNPWTWRCLNAATAQCVKERKVEGSMDQMNLEACKLTCGPYGSLMPFPRKTMLGKTTVRFSPNSITTGTTDCVEGVCRLLHEAVEIFKETVLRYNPSYTESSDSNTIFSGPVIDQKLILDISIDGKDQQLILSTNESYTLNVITRGEVITATIKSPTFFGARHALETLSQLIEYDKEYNSLQIVSEATISDQPYYKYRGLIIDTARNFLSLERLKKVIDGMAYSKLNNFHWHLTDSQSFTLYTRSLPNMTRFGAYSEREIYMPDEVSEFVDYARVRGVRIIPEFVAPAHVGEGWQWGPEAGLGNLTVCFKKQPWQNFCDGPPCGQLNMANDNIYTVLSKIYQDWTAMFGQLELFHFGGDEIKLSCWNSSEEIVTWLQKKGLDLSPDSYFEEWGIFQEKVYDLFTAANNGVPAQGILWTSKLTDPSRITKHLDKNKYIIQVWTKGNDSIISDLLEKGYKIILSNYDKLYFDCGVSSWVSSGKNWCAPYKGWQDVYGNDITSIFKKAAGERNVDGQILGGEAAVWSEQIDDSTIEAKIWPRAAALAERLWSDPKSNYRAADTRMLEHRRRLALRGLMPSRLQPEWCRQNSLDCHQVSDVNEDGDKEETMTPENLANQHLPNILLLCSICFLMLIMLSVHMY